MANLEFAIIDVETTGLFPAGHDLIAEVAALRLGGDDSPTRGRADRREGGAI